MPDLSASTNQTILAFDFGLQRIGVAVGQLLTQTAQPLTTLRNSSGVPDWRAIEQLKQEWQANAFVIGLPLNKDGADNPITIATKKFAQAMAQRFQLPVHLIDERYSSITAQELLKTQRQSGHRKRRLKKEDTDKIAAAIILQSWFQSR